MKMVALTASFFSRMSSRMRLTDECRRFVASSRGGPNARRSRRGSTKRQGTTTKMAANNATPTTEELSSTDTTTTATRNVLPREGGEHVQSYLQREAEHDQALMFVAAARPYRALKPQAYEFDLTEPIYFSNVFDKTLILLRHGEDESQSHGFSSYASTSIDQNAVRDPSLTGRGFQESLELSNWVALHCNEETGLEPDLVVVSPLRRVLQTTLLAFPDVSPASTRYVPWVCHPGLLECTKGDSVNDPSPLDDLQLTVPGLDFSLYEDSTYANSDSSSSSSSNVGSKSSDTEWSNQSLQGAVVSDDDASDPTASMYESKERLLRQTDEFVEWLRSREEQVIVVSAQSTWLRAFCEVGIDYHGSSKPFQNGELRVVGVNF